ncbi:MAG: DUF3139 domain-containing protein [Bacillus sp. (in: Bacteria)]|nr:DUF3139 domain-containing protein [Bacillus sp. (in: firmicutes)]
MLKKIGLSFILVVLVSFVFFVYDQFNGNPVSKYRAAKALDSYLEEVYPEKELRRSNGGYYDFKFNEYGFAVTNIGNGTIQAEEVGSETSEKIPDVRDYYFTVAGFFQPEVRMDGIRLSQIDQIMTERISEEAGEEIIAFLKTTLNNVYAVDVRAEVLKGQLDEGVHWDKTLPLDRPITIFIVLDSSDDKLEKFYNDTVLIQELLNDSGYDYERVTINGNVISFNGIGEEEDRNEHRGYVKFGFGFDKNEEVKKKNIREF